MNDMLTEWYAAFLNYCTGRSKICDAIVDDVHANADEWRTTRDRFYRKGTDHFHIWVADGKKGLMVKESSVNEIHRFTRAERRRIWKTYRWWLDYKETADANRLLRRLGIGLPVPNAYKFTDIQEDDE